MENNNNVLFLDIDGVLSRAEYSKDLYEDTYGDYCLALHRPSVEALRKLLQKIPDLKIVWISDWAKCERGICSKQNCYIDPLQALELFPWLKERVIGDIFGGLYSHGGILGNGSKLNAIESYVSCNNIKQYAIVDDNDYDKVDAMLAGNAQILEHIVQINPLKSFLEDDLLKVERILYTPSKDGIYSMFIDAKAGDVFIVNNSMKCTVVDDTKDIKEDSNCPRQYIEMKVDAKDLSSGKDLVGLVVMSYDKDTKRKNVSLYTKSSETLISFQSYVNITEATQLAQEEHR